MQPLLHDSEEEVPRSDPNPSVDASGSTPSELVDHALDSDMGDYAAQLKELSALFYVMHIILERTKRDLGDFCYKKDQVVSLIGDGDLPGIDVVAVLHATTPIIQGAIETNISTIEKFREMISVMKQAMECEPSLSTSEEPAYWSPSSDNEAWNIALPGDEDVLTESSLDSEVEGPISNTLQYHKDVTEVESPRVFIPSQPSAAHNKSHSRRVALHALPSDTNVIQVLNAIRCYGGAVSVFVTNDLCGRNSTQKSALIEFVYVDAAANFVLQLQQQSLKFEDSTQEAHLVRCYHVSTPSWYQTELNYELLSAGATRCLCLPGFPANAIWYLTSTLGLGAMSKIDLQDHETLIIEFVSLFQADRAYRLIRRGGLNIDYDAAGNKMRYMPDSSQGDMEELYRSTKGLIRYVEPDILKKTWDQKPFNSYWPTNEFGSVSSNAAKVVEQVNRPPKRSVEDLLAEHFGIEASEVWEFLEDRKHFQDTTYKIIGSNIALTRHKYSWSISQEDNMKLLMANTIHDPEWAHEWDAYFKSRGTINLRTLERYGMLAAHRRQLAGEQGLEAWSVPRCKGCELACRELKDTPVCPIIREWCTGRQADE